MSIIKTVIGLATSEIGRTVISASIGAVLGGIATWWKFRDKYQAHVTWETCETIYGPRETPVIVIQSVHTLPINVTRLRVRNGFRWKTGAWPFDSEDPEYPTLPRTIEPMTATRFWLSEDALSKAVTESRVLNWLWVPRVYIGVETMGRGERLFVAEGGIDWNKRRKRYQR